MAVTFFAETKHHKQVIDIVLIWYNANELFMIFTFRLVQGTEFFSEFSLPNIDL